MKVDQLRLLLSGLAAGDCIGSLTEFVPQSEVPPIYAKYRDEGWPFAAARGPVWDKGEPTDDTEMAMCIARSCLRCGRFDAEAVAQEFVAWLDSNPKDIGGTTVRSLSRLRAGMAWHETGYREHQARPNNAANGSLMRNGIIPAMADTLEQAFTYTAHHAMITHYDPLSMLCCAVQTWMIWHLLQGRWPLDEDWQLSFREDWTGWLSGSTDSSIGKWHRRVEPRLPAAWDGFLAVPFAPNQFSPFEVDFIGRTGYCLLTLQIAIWTLDWSRRSEPFAVPAGFPTEVFEKRGAWCIGWPAMVGYDADTYGAVSGPLIAAAYGTLPESASRGLRALSQLVLLCQLHVREQIS